VYVREVWVSDLELVDYRECAELQARLAALRFDGRIADTLLLLEHPPVITLGTSGGVDSLIADPETVKAAGVEIVRTDRGGNATYHGPGQVVGYPVIDLREYGRDAHLMLRNLEQVVIDFLADYGVIGDRIDKLTGVWVGGEKICSIGIAVRRWVSYHGFALNIDPNFDHWSLLHPCGLIDKHVTSLAKLLGHSVPMSEVKAGLILHFADVFRTEPVTMGCQQLMDAVQAVGN